MARAGTAYNAFAGACGVDTSASVVTTATCHSASTSPGSTYGTGSAEAFSTRRAWCPSIAPRSADESPYRRFFDVNAMVAMRVERDEVFEAVHRRLPLAWLRDGIADGLRVSAANAETSETASAKRNAGSNCKR